MNLIQVLTTYPNVTSCGAQPITAQIAYIIHTIITLIQYGVPLLLIMFDMLDLGKAVVASKEDEIKKGQQMFIKRLIAAVIVFFVVSVVELVVGLAANDDGGIKDCINAIVNYKY